MATKGSALNPGQRIGELLLRGRVRSATTGNYALRRRWRCDCSCGASITVPEQYLVRDNPKKHCGDVKKHISTFQSLHKTEHGIWTMMHVRCEDPRHVGYPHYGARGVKVCERWHKTNPEGFANFIADMGRRPSKKHSIDRIDPDGNYELRKADGTLQCKWSTWDEQNNNKRFHKEYRAERAAQEQKP